MDKGKLTKDYSHIDKAVNSNEKNGNQGHGSPYSVAVFTASSMGKDPGYARDASYVGKKIGKAGYRLVYGGGSRGLMGVVSKAALKEGGKIKGYLMAEFKEAADYPQKQHEVMAPDVSIRKQQMMNDADAFIILAGGFGTLDELADAGCEQYLGGYMNPPVPVKPIIVINRNGLYDSFKSQLSKMVDEGLANEKVFDMFTFVKDGREAIEALQRLRYDDPRYLPQIGNMDHGASL